MQPIKMKRIVQRLRSFIQSFFSNPIGHFGRAIAIRPINFILYMHYIVKTANAQAPYSVQEYME